MEITVKEIIASITILAIMLILGFLIGDKINDSHYDRISKYNKALKVKDEDVFRYAMRTSVGNAFVEGEFKALDTVGYDELKGEYMFVRKVKEKYTRHTRTTTYTVNGKTRTKTETYWTWDRVDSESKKCKNVAFLGVKFPSSKFRLPNDSFIETQKVSPRIRYKYYGTPISHKGVAFVDLREGDISNEKVLLEIDTTTEQLLELYQFNIWIYVFWVIWLGITGGVIYYFYYLDNDWLNL